jgi:hypothetical protein
LGKYHEEAKIKCKEKMNENKKKLFKEVLSNSNLKCSTSNNTKILKAIAMGGHVDC